MNILSIVKIERLIYTNILENNLENTEIDLTGYIPIEDFANMYGVGTETVKVWIELGQTPAVKIGDKYYIHHVDITKK